MNISPRPPPLNLNKARLKQRQSLDKLPKSGNSSGSLSPNLQPASPPTFPIINEQFVPSRIGNYVILNQIEASTLYRCVNSVTLQECVCKVIPTERVRDSLGGHYRLDGHPHVNTVEEVLIGESKAYLIYSPSYGDLHSHIRAKRRLREPEAVSYFKQVVEAVSACHANGIVLRDLKLRKFVFKDPRKTLLKLESVDEGVVLEDEDSEDWLQDKHGCPAYVSPEILETTGSYSGKAADCWSLGVMLYTMLVGRYPFHDSNPTLLFNKIKSGTYTLPDTLSSKAKCLIRSLLRMDPTERLTAEDVLDHPWFKLLENKNSGSLFGNLNATDSQRLGTGPCHSSGSRLREDAKVPDQTVPDLAIPEDASSMFS